MNIEAKPNTIIKIALVIAVLVAGYFYMKKTKPIRAYKAELRKLRIIEEHQRLEIEVALQRKDLAELKKEAEKNMPQLNLTPKEQNVD